MPAVLERQAHRTVNNAATHRGANTLIPNGLAEELRITTHPEIESYLQQLLDPLISAARKELPGLPNIELALSDAGGYAAALSETHDPKIIVDKHLLETVSW